MDQKQKPNKTNKWFQLINLPIQMGVIVFAFAYIGKWLDGEYPNPHRIYVKSLTMLGVIIAFYNVNRQLKNINNSD